MKPAWTARDPRFRALIDAAEDLHDEVRAREPALEASPRATLTGIGWGTVDLDRAASAFTAVDRPDEDLRWQPLPRDSLLGATARRLRGSVPALVLLEPDNEGPLAAAVARHDEGLAAIYLEVPDGAAALGGRKGSGPFGPEILLPGPRWGPHVVVVTAGIPSADDRSPRRGRPPRSAR